ncbi:MAG TPA: membrane protein insertase YidC, partial [Pyrinomonadaceae bacterium]|nr:membrane protein insertase YidC [Pyrinomonadaceae bacterium]
MENPGNSSNQSRFLIAAVLSMVVLFGWSYYFAPKKPTDNANANVAANTAPAATPQPAPTAQAPQQPATAAATTPDSTPNRTITIKSPLYEVTLDSKGALATSWVIVKNLGPRSEFPVYADGSTDAEKNPLQLISPYALSQSPREIPFRLSTDDQNINTLVNDRNYQISVAEDTITLAAGEERPIEFTLTDASGVEVKKSFVFRANSYVADLGISLKKGGQPVPNTKLLIGASVGDQGIPHHNFYHIEPEAIASGTEGVNRKQGTSFTFDAANQGTLPVTGNVDWAGVGDAYFAMAAIPATPSNGAEYRATKYDVPTPPFFGSIFQWVMRNPQTSETRHLMTVYLPITADGSVTRIFTGTKDYFLLSSLDGSLPKDVGRQVEITNLINFSNYSWIRPLTSRLSIPILYSLNFFNGLTHNYGVAIIIFTFLFYSLLFPLRWSQSRSFKKASGNAPKMKDIQDRIKDLQKKGVPTDDPRMRQLQMEQLKMTKDALPIGGCLPMLLQFPLLIAFYTAVTVSLDIRQATFIWLPDLSAADPWHLLEFAFAISMILSMKFTPQAATVTPEQQMQQKMMTYFMPLMMLWVMWSAPAGLLLYWFFGNIVSFGQQ